MLPSAADLQCIEKILRECGSILMVCRTAGKTEGEWSGEQFKAAADKIAHDFLVTALGEAFPGIPVVSEEDPVSMSVCTADHFIIDPIDGTASFVHGFAGWVTQIAYVCANRPVFAGIYAPSSDEYFSALRGNGAYCNGGRLSLSGSTRSAHSLIDNYPEARGITQDLQQALGIPVYVESGSIALKICRIADRGADLFFKNMSPRDWDVAAPLLVLEEAGGFITDAQGFALNLGGADRRHCGLIAAAHSAVIEQVADWYTSLK